MIRFDINSSRLKEYAKRKTKLQLQINYYLPPFLPARNEESDEAGPG